METYTDLYTRLYSYDNLLLAWKKARKRKTLKGYVIEFESNLEGNLNQLQRELETFTYSPAPITTFIVRDPKTRKIGASHFRDRVIHHAVCNIIVPIFEKGFIYDSFANQKGKGVHIAINRLENFIRKTAIAIVSDSGVKYLGDSCIGYALKADIKHYFDSIDHEVLLGIIERKIKDKSVIWLIKLILNNHKTKVIGKGMPLGNLTSQFFANVYLNDFDQFVKHELKIKHYIRYVDDFIIVHRDMRQLERWKIEIDNFLKTRLKIELHRDKSKVIPLKNGIAFLGFRVFRHHRLLKKSNARRIWKRLDKFKKKHDAAKITLQDANRSLEGWIAYAKFANTYNFRKRVVTRFNNIFTERHSPN